jgi:hypothetical protein
MFENIQMMNSARNSIRAHYIIIIIIIIIIICSLAPRVKYKGEGVTAGL